MPWSMCVCVCMCVNMTPFSFFFVASRAPLRTKRGNNNSSSSSHGSTVQKMNAAIGRGFWDGEKKKMLPRLTSPRPSKDHRKSRMCLHLECFHAGSVHSCAWRDFVFAFIFFLSSRCEHETRRTNTTLCLLALWGAILFRHNDDDLFTSHKSYVQFNISIYRSSAHIRRTESKSLT